LKLEFNFNESGVIPFRKKDGKLDILLITSIKKKKWIVPKGFIEFNLSPFESAKKEAYEEAGILGTNETIELGSFELEKSSGKIQMKIYSMEVTEVLDDYPEKDLRKRKWFSIEEAVKNISIPPISTMITKMKEKIKL
jgi:8-oxo-dGTP pyrophosphatase MutT (NUDIX family)